MLVIVQPNTKVISTSDRRTDGRTNVSDDNNSFFLEERKRILKKRKLHFVLKLYVALTMSDIHDVSSPGSTLQCDRHDNHMRDTGHNCHMCSKTIM